MPDEERLTREQWEEREWLEREMTRRYSVARGDLFASVILEGDQIGRQKPAQLEALIDAKLAQVKASLLDEVEARRGGWRG